MAALRFTVEEADAAYEEWRFNCGPAALCAVLDMSPAEIRPHMLDFERKGHTNPTLMADVLRGLQVPFQRVLQSQAEPAKWPAMPDLGLMRVQWDGAWTAPGVPMAARYQHTHWVGLRRTPDKGGEVFDVNATCSGGWLAWKEWVCQLVPWLLKECQPKSNGLWWPTHIWEICGKRATPPDT